jgi:hypothetical protein
MFGTLTFATTSFGDDGADSSASASTGTVTATLDNATLAATGSLGLNGSVTVTLGAVTLAATGSLSLTGSVTATLAPVTAVSSGSLALDGAVTATLADVTLAAAGSLAIRGSVTATLDDVTATVAATVPQTTHLTGRPLRGKRIVFPDELDPLVPDNEPVAAELPRETILPVFVAVVEAQTRLDAAQAEMEAQQRSQAIGRELRRVTAAYQAALSDYEQSKERERRHIERLRADDEFWLMAA